MRRIEGRTTNLVLQITPLERDALQLLSKGMPLSELSGVLHLTVPETELLVTRLLATLGATTRAEAVGVARKRGLLTSDLIRVEQLG